MKKKLLAMLLCMALIVPAAACGSSTGTAAPAQEEKTEEAAPAEEAKAEEAPAEEAKAEETAPAEQPAAEEPAQEETAEVEVTEADLSGKLDTVDEQADMPTLKEALPEEASEEDAAANEEFAANLKINDATQEVQASLASDQQALSYGGVIMLVPASWEWEVTDDGYLMTYPQDGHCFILMNGTGIRGYDTNALMAALKDGLRGEGQTVSDYTAGGKAGLKAEYYGQISGINVKITDYYFLPNDTWLLQVKCVSTTTESFDSILQTIDFRYAVTN